MYWKNTKGKYVILLEQNRKASL